MHPGKGKPPALALAAPKSAGHTAVMLSKSRNLQSVIKTSRCRGCYPGAWRRAIDLTSSELQPPVWPRRKLQQIGHVPAFVDTIFPRPWWAIDEIDAITRPSFDFYSAPITRWLSQSPESVSAPVGLIGFQDVWVITKWLGGKRSTYIQSV